MKREHNRSASSCPRGTSRRDFLKLAVAGLLAGCSPIRQPAATPVPSPSASLGINSAEGPTSEPTTAPTSAATAAPTSAPTATPVPADALPRTPDALSKVVRARRAGVWDGDALVPQAIRQMLDGSITELTGLGDATEAWASLFDPGERIAIKVNTIASSDFWTHVPLVMAVTDCLQDAGVPAGQIVIFDRQTRELEYAGFPVNEDGPGVRCCGTEFNYTAGWAIMDTDIRFSDILLNCDALINMPILKHHNHSGVTFAMKNHFGTFDRPRSFHRPRTGPAIAELNSPSPIQDRTRLVIGDTLTVCPPSRGGWHQAVAGDSILVSFDPVAHDAVGLQMLGEVIASAGIDPAPAIDLASGWLTSSAGLGLGTNDPDSIELVEVTL